MANISDIIDVEFETIRAPNYHEVAGKALSDKPDKYSTASQCDAQLNVFSSVRVDQSPSLRAQILGNAKMSAPIFAILSFFVCLLAFLIAGGYTLLMPTKTAPISGQNIRNDVDLSSYLEISDVHMSYENNKGQLVLIIRAQIRNTFNKPVKVPNLAMTFPTMNTPDKNFPKSYVIYREEWLAPNEHLAFTKHIAATHIPSSEPEFEFIIR